MKKERPYIRSNKVISKKGEKPKVRVKIVVYRNGGDWVKTKTYKCINTSDMAWIAEQFRKKWL
jgi:hypothetical protein